MGVAVRSGSSVSGTRGRFRLRSRLVAVTVALMTVAGLASVISGAGTADARVNGTPAGKSEWWIDACGMPTNGAFGNKSMNPGRVKVRSWFKPGNTRTVILLDGMRAQYDFSGWEINTNVQELVNRGVNVVEPIGGPASFYTDWNAPSNSKSGKTCLFVLHQAGASSCCFAWTPSRRWNRPTTSPLP